MPEGSCPSFELLLDGIMQCLLLLSKTVCEMFQSRGWSYLEQKGIAALDGREGGREGPRTPSVDGTCLAYKI